MLRSQDSVQAAFDVPEDSEINFLEHVEVEVNIEYPVRGVLEVVIVSPAG